MKRGLLLGGFVMGFAAAAALGLAPQKAGDSHGTGGKSNEHGAAGGAAGQHDGAPPMSPEQAAMMQAWTEYMTPGDEHARLAKMAGNWECDVKMFMAPGEPPTESKATAKYAMGMGGRYLIEHVDGDFMGSPFEGMGITGYDNAAKQYVFAWIDSVGTGIMRGTGTYDADHKVLNTQSWTVDPMTGKEKKARGRETYVDADTKIAEMWDTLPDGTEFKMMEITYRRKK